MNLNDAPDRADLHLPLFASQTPKSTSARHHPRARFARSFSRPPPTLSTTRTCSLCSSLRSNRPTARANSHAPHSSPSPRPHGSWQPLSTASPRLPDLTRAHLILIKTAETLANRHARASLPDDLRPDARQLHQGHRLLPNPGRPRSVEEFHLLHLDIKNRLIRDEIHQRGTINHTPVYTREVCLRALDIGSSAMIVLHNHPSGCSDPSRADVATTERLRDALKLIEVTLHDHLILTPSDDYSFREKGLL